MYRPVELKKRTFRSLTVGKSKSEQIKTKLGLTNKQINKQTAVSCPDSSSFFFNEKASFGVASAVSDCLSLFSLFRFFAGAGTIGCLLVRFVYCIEMVVTAHRSYIGMINMLFLTVGGCFLALLAYLIPDWRYLMLAVSLPGFLPLVVWW